MSAGGGASMPEIQQTRTKTRAAVPDCPGCMDVTVDPQKNTPNPISFDHSDFRLLVLQP